MPRRFAIIGANGFVARHVTELARSRGLDVVGVVRSEAAERLVERLGAVPLRVDDLGDDSVLSLAQGLRECEAVAYTAGVVAGPGAFDRTDPSGLLNVIAACRRSGVRRIVFLSGLGVAHYGMREHCTNPYFLAKLAGEIALFRSGIASTVLRPSYIFGAGDEFLGPLMRRIARESVIEIPGDGSYRLQPVSVEDTARAVLAAMEPREEIPSVFDLVGPEILSYRELVARAAAVLGRSVAISSRPVEQAVRASRTSSYLGLRSHDLACLLCDEVSDAQLIKDLLGQPLETLDVMISRAAGPLLSESARK